MAQLLVRNLEDEVVAELKKRAARSSAPRPRPGQAEGVGLRRHALRSHRRLGVPCRGRRPVGKIVTPLIILGIVMASWALRPESRKMGGATSAIA